MTNRVEVVESMAQVFVVTRELLDNKNYPYDKVESMWGDHIRAVDHIETSIKDADYRKVTLRHLNLLSNGRVEWHNVTTVWEGGAWVSSAHDPRAKDPEYREYLRLKEKYE